MRKQIFIFLENQERTSPDLPYIEKTDYLTLSQFTLKELIRQTIFSIADNENNKLMTGELFEVHNNELKVVSLDGTPYFYP